MDFCEEIDLKKEKIVIRESEATDLAEYLNSKFTNHQKNDSYSSFKKEKKSVRALDKQAGIIFETKLKIKGGNK